MYGRLSSRKVSVCDRAFDQTTKPFLGFSDGNKECEIYYDRFQKVRKSYLSPRVVLERINYSHDGRVTKKIFNNIKRVGAKQSRRSETQLDNDVLDRLRKRPIRSGNSECRIPLERIVEKERRIQTRRSIKCRNLLQVEPKTKPVRGLRKRYNQATLKDKFQLCSSDHSGKNGECDCSLTVDRGIVPKDSADLILEEGSKVQDQLSQKLIVHPEDKDDAKCTRSRSKCSVRSGSKFGSQHVHNSGKSRKCDGSTGPKVSAELNESAVELLSGRETKKNKNFTGRARCPPKRFSRSSLKIKHHLINVARQVHNKGETGNVSCHKKHAKDIDLNPIIDNTSRYEEGIKHCSCNRPEMSVGIGIRDFPLDAPCLLSTSPSPCCSKSKAPVEKSGRNNGSVEVVDSTSVLTGSIEDAEDELQPVTAGTLQTSRKGPEYCSSENQMGSDDSYKGKDVGDRFPDDGITAVSVEYSHPTERDTVLESEPSRKPTKNPASCQDDSDVDVKSHFLDADISLNLRGPERCSCHGDVECSGSDMDVCNSPLAVQDGVAGDKNSSVPGPNTSEFSLEEIAGKRESFPVRNLRESTIEIDSYFESKRILDTTIGFESDVIDVDGSEEGSDAAKIVESQFLNYDDSRNSEDNPRGVPDQVVVENIPTEQPLGFEIPLEFSSENGAVVPSQCSEKSMIHLETQHGTVSPLFDNLHISPSWKSVAQKPGYVQPGKSESKPSSSKIASDLARQEMRALLKPCVVRLERMPDIEKIVRRNETVPCPIIIKTSRKQSTCMCSQERPAREKHSAVDVRAHKKKFDESPVGGTEGFTKIDLSDGFTLRKLCELKSISLTDSSSDEENDGPGGCTSSSISHHVLPASSPRELVEPRNQPSIGSDLSNPTEALVQVDRSADSVVSENPVPSRVQALNKLGFLERSDSFQFGEDPLSESAWSDALDFCEAMGDTAASKRKLGELLPPSFRDVMSCVNSKERTTFDEVSTCKEFDERDIMKSEMKKDLEERVARFCCEFLGSAYLEDTDPLKSIEVPHSKSSESAPEAKLGRESKVRVYLDSRGKIPFRVLNIKQNEEKIENKGMPPKDKHDAFYPAHLDVECVEKDKLMCEGEEEKPHLEMPKITLAETLGESEFLTSLMRPASPPKDSRKQARKENTEKRRKQKCLGEPWNVDSYGKAQDMPDDRKRKKLTSCRGPNDMGGAEKPHGSPPASKRKALKLPSRKPQHPGENLIDEQVEADRVARELKYRLSTNWMMTKIVGIEEKFSSEGVARDRKISDEELPTRERLYRDLSTIPYILKCSFQNKCRKFKDLNTCANANKKFKLFFTLTVGAGRKLSRHLIETLKDAEDTCKINRTSAFIAASAVLSQPTTIFVPAYPDVVQKLIPTYHASVLMELVAKTEEREKREKKMVSNMNIAETLQSRRALIDVNSRFQKGNQDPPQSQQSAPEAHQSLQQGIPDLYQSNQIVSMKSKIDNKFKFVKKCLASVLPKDCNKGVRQQCTDFTEKRSIESQEDQVLHVASGSPSKSISSSDRSPDALKETPLIHSARSTEPSFRSLLLQRYCQKNMYNGSLAKIQVASVRNDENHDESMEPLRKKLVLDSPRSGSIIPDKVPQILEAVLFSGTASDSSGTTNGTSSAVGTYGCSSGTNCVSSIECEDVAVSKSPLFKLCSNDPRRSSFARNDAHQKQAENQILRKSNDPQPANEETPDVILIPEKYESIDLTAGEDDSTDKNSPVPKWATICIALPELGFVSVQKHEGKLLIYDRAVVPGPIELDGMEEMGMFLNARLADLTFPHGEKVNLEWILVTSGYLIMKAIPHTNPLFWLPPYTARKTLTDMRNYVKRYGLSRSMTRKRQTKAIKTSLSTLRHLRQFDSVGKLVRINGRSLVMGSPANCGKQQNDMPVVRISGQSVVMDTPVDHSEPQNETPVVQISGKSVVTCTPANYSNRLSGTPYTSGSTGQTVVFERSSATSATGSTPPSPPMNRFVVVTRPGSGPQTHLVYTKASLGYVPLVTTAESTTVQDKSSATSATTTCKPRKKSSKFTANTQSLNYVPNKQTASTPRLLVLPATSPSTSLRTSLTLTSSQPVTVNSVMSSVDAPRQTTGISLAPAISQGPSISSAPSIQIPSTFQVPRMSTAITTVRLPQLIVSSAPGNPTPASSSAPNQTNIHKPLKQLMVKPGCVKYVTLASIVPGSLAVGNPNSQAGTKISSPATASVKHVSGVVSVVQSSGATPTTTTAAVPSTPRLPAPAVCASTALSQKLSEALYQKLAPLDKNRSSRSKNRPILILKNGTSGSIGKARRIKFVCQKQ